MIMNDIRLCVSSDGTELYSDLQTALNEAMQIIPLPGRKIVIHIKTGTYSGQFFYDGEIPLVLEGDGMNRTVITGNLAATMPPPAGSEGFKLGTFRTYTLYAGGTSVSIRNMTIENTAGLTPPYGLGKAAGQAVALYAAARYVSCFHVELLGHQDTLFCAPLPEAEREPGGFIGPDRSSPRIPSTQLYDHCRIAGTVDFIFGGATALFRKCEIVVRRPLDGKNVAESGSSPCYIAAPSQDSAENENYYGFVFHKCRVLSIQSLVPSVFRNTGDSASVYLARPWRPYGKCAYIKCFLDRIISPEGWHIWDKETDAETAVFAEYRNRGPGADMSKRSFGSQLTREEAKKLLQTIRKIFIFLEKVTIY